MGFDVAMLDRATQTFWADLWGNAPVDAIYECGIVEKRFGPVQGNVVEELADTPSYNTIRGGAEPGAVLGGHLAAAVEWGDGLDIDYRVEISHGQSEADVAEALLSERGFEQGETLIRYVRNAKVPPQLAGVRGVTVWEIGVDGDEAVAGETMALTVAPALGIPGAIGCMMVDLPAQERWRCYTAELEEDIVSFGSVLISGGVALLGFEGTVEEFRRRGCNQALLRARILAAQEAGCETIFASVPAHGEDAAANARNLVRAGFVPAHRTVNWQRPR